MKVKQTLLYSVLALSSVALFACGDDDSSTTKTTLSVPRTYTFDSHFDPGTPTVAYSGQTARQVLIADLNTKILKGLDADITENTIVAGTPHADVLSALNLYYSSGTAVLGTTPITTGIKAGDTVNTGTLQTTYAGINATKTLVDKIAGNDDGHADGAETGTAIGVTGSEHKDWDNGDFVGYTTTSPHDLIQTWLGEIATNTLAQIAGPRVDPVNGAPLKLYQSADGLDYRQLVQKFLLGAVTFSQGTDDYLDEGLTTDNVARDKGTQPYTKLEHQFDEGFGCFGAARNYNDYTDNEIKGSSGRGAFKFGYNDINGDTKIDLFSEFNFGNSTNAAKRDVGSTTGTDFTKAIFDAFLRGRAIINNAAGSALNATERSALEAQRDIIVLNWEKAIAATVVHYINDVLGDMTKFTNNDPASPYSYGTHIKHWGELKGFALGFQFNPRSPLTDAQFLDFHTKVGEKPVLPTVAGIPNMPAYRTALEGARTILQTAYSFDPSDVAGW